MPVVAVFAFVVAQVGLVVLVDGVFGIVFCGVAAFVVVGAVLYPVVGVVGSVLVAVLSDHFFYSFSISGFSWV